MPSVQIKNVPDGTHEVLRRRAAASHQSLQEYLLARLVAEASVPTLEEALERVSADAQGSLGFADSVTSLADERAGR